MQARNNLTVRVRNQKLHLNGGARNGVRNLLLQLLNTLTGTSRNDHVLRLALAHTLQHERVGGIRLIQHNNLGDMAGVNLRNDLADSTNLPLRVRVRSIHHVQDDVSIRDLFQGGAERLHQLGRQRTHETHRVREGVADTVRGLSLTDGRVQGRKQGVLHEHAGIGQTVQKGGLTRVRVPGNSHRRHAVTATVQTLRLTRRRHRSDLTLKLRHASAQAAAVHLNLGFTGTTRTDTLTGCGTATRLTGQGRTPTTQTRQHVLQLSQLNLCLTLAGLSVLSENVENQGGAVNDLDLHDVFEGTTLRGSQFGVDDDGVGAGRLHNVLEFQRLTGAEEGAGVRLEAALNQAVQNLGTCGFSQCRELTQRVLGVLYGAFSPQTSQHHALQAQLAVLDLGDVFKFGGEVRDTAQGAALSEIFLVTVIFGVLALNVRNFARASIQHTAASVAAVGAGGVIAVMRGTGGVISSDGGGGLGAAQNAVYGAAQLLIAGQLFGIRYGGVLRIHTPLILPPLPASGRGFGRLCAQGVQATAPPRAYSARVRRVLALPVHWIA